MAQEAETTETAETETTETAAGAEATETETETDGLDEAALRAELKKTREEAARHRVAAREARARAKEYEDQNKTEAQKLQERAETAEKNLAAAERSALVASVALNKGLTEAQAKRLIGTTKEELEADADELLDSFKPNDDDGGRGRPEGRASGCGRSRSLR